MVFAQENLRFSVESTYSLSQAKITFKRYAVSSSQKNLFEFNNNIYEISHLHGGSRF